MGAIVSSWNNLMRYSYSSEINLYIKFESFFFIISSGFFIISIFFFHHIQCFFFFVRSNVFFSSYPLYQTPIESLDYWPTCTNTNAVWWAMLSKISNWSPRGRLHLITGELRVIIPQKDSPQSCVSLMTANQIMRVELAFELLCFISHFNEIINGYSRLS